MLLIACATIACGARSELDVGSFDASTSDATRDVAIVVDVTSPVADAQADVATCTSCDGTCVSGRCIVTLAKGPATALAVDATTLYWTNAGDCTDPAHCNGTVSMVGKNGGAPVLLAFDLAHPRPIAVDATRVYVGTDYALWTIPVGGGPPTVFVPWTMAASIAVDHDDVYWTNSIANTVMRAPLDGGAPTTIATDQSWVQGIAIDATNVYWAVPGTEPTGYTDGWIATAPLAGGATTTLASNQLLPDGLALAGARLYWSDYNPTVGAITEDAIDGGAAAILAPAQTYPNHVVADDAYVYWTALGTIPNDYADGVVEKMSLAGGPITTIASAQSFASAIVIDEDSVYWIASNAIMKATPK